MRRWLINRGGDADDVLRAVVQALQKRAGYGFVEIAFVEGERLEPGPAVGSVSGHAHGTPIVFEGRTVGELRVATTRGRRGTCVPGARRDPRLALLPRGVGHGRRALVGPLLKLLERGVRRA